MKRFRDILVTDLSKFDMEEWDGKFLFHNYERIKSYVSANFGADSFDLFSRPKTERQNESIVWQSDIFEHSPLPLSALKGEERDRYISILSKKIQSFEKMIAQIEQSGKNKDWAKLLQKTLLNGGEDFIFCPYCSRILFYEESIEGEEDFFNTEDTGSLSDLDEMDEDDNDEDENEEEDEEEKVNIEYEE